MIWLGWVLWHINLCRLFNAKSSLYIYIKYIWFGWVGLGWVLWHINLCRLFNAKSSLWEYYWCYGWQYMIERAGEHTLEHFFISWILILNNEKKHKIIKKENSLVFNQNCLNYIYIYIERERERILQKYHNCQRVNTMTCLVLNSCCYSCILCHSKLILHSIALAPNKKIS